MVDKSYGRFVRCYKIGPAAIPAPRNHEAHFFEIELKENEIYKDENDVIVAVSSFNNTKCTNGVSILIPEAGGDVTTYRELVEKFIQNDI